MPIIYMRSQLLIKEELMAETKYKTGEKPGKGCYECTNCGTDITLEADEKMPPCPKCSNTVYTKIGN